MNSRSSPSAAVSKRSRVESKSTLTTLGLPRGQIVDPDLRTVLRRPADQHLSRASGYEGPLPADREETYIPRGQHSPRSAPEPIRSLTGPWLDELVRSRGG